MKKVNENGKGSGWILACIRMTKWGKCQKHSMGDRHGPGREKEEEYVKVCITMNKNKKTIGGKNDKKINKGTKDENRYEGDEKPLFFTKNGGSALDPCGRTDYL